MPTACASRSAATSRSVRARREVLLCAGAIHSPAVLQRSGIGPRAWLDALGIKVVADRPVGQHLLDHPILSVLLDLQGRRAGQHARAPPHQLLHPLLLRPRRCRAPTT